MAIPVFTAYPNSVSARAVFAAQMDQMISEFPAFIAALNALGITGGVMAIPYTFSTTTADADPGAGLLRLNHATQNLATVIRADLLANNTTDWTTVLDTFDDSTSTVKGQLGLVDLNDGTKFLIFNVTAVATPSGYRNITVAAIGGSAASPFADGASLLLTFTRTGDKGTTGDTGAAGVSAGPAYTYSTTTTAADPGAGFVRLNHATLASATALYISETDANASSIAGLLATWDDSTNTAKGTLRIEKLGDPSKFAVYTITGSLTDNGTWDTFALAYVAGTTLANNDSVVLSFARAGDAGAAAAGPGSVVLADFTPLASPNIDLLSVFTSDYDNYKILITGVKLSAADSIGIRLATGGAVDSGSNYLQTVNGSAGGSTVTTTATGMFFAAGIQAGGEGMNADMTVLNANDAVGPKSLDSLATFHQAASVGYATYWSGLAYKAANTVSGFRLYTNGGNNFVAAGRVRVIGYRNTV